MSICQRCVGHKGKVVYTAPHTRMLSQSTRIAGDSDTYAYTCRDCTTKWLRVVPKPTESAAATWRSVAHLPHM
jgi:hypothetical protein